MKLELTKEERNMCIASLHMFLSYPLLRKDEEEATNSVLKKLIKDLVNDKK